MSVWKVYTKKANFKAIGSKYGIDQVLARIIRNRDIKTDQEIDMYINGTTDSMHDPRTMKDMDHAARIVQDKIQSNKKIRIIGDYDIDGICSIYILYTGLQKIGAAVDYVVPNRVTDGYGINENLIKQAYEEGIDTIITCDNGIAAINQIQYAKNLGMTVIVTDHHDIPYVEQDGKRIYLSSQADAIVNPKQLECKYPFKLLCGASVAYKLIQVLYEEYHVHVMELEELTEYMAIATVGDIVDLQDENRVIVKYGLQHIRNTKNEGLKALIHLCGLEPDKISAYHIGFVIGPCLNASGRLDTAKKALDMLLETNVDKAYELAANLKSLNDERKEMTAEETKKAIELVENSELKKDTVLIVYLPTCHESIAGIIAGRLRERFYKPSIVLTDGECDVKGSGRSIDGYNMFEEINKCKDILLKFGGHPMAAGMSLENNHIDEFRRRLNKYTTLTDDQLVPIEWIDVPMPVDYVTPEFIRQLSILEPFGKGNEKPLFADKNLIVRNVTIIGKNRNVLKMSLENERGYIADAIMFNMSENDAIVRGDKISVIYYPDINEYNGKQSLQYKVIAIKK